MGGGVGKVGQLRTSGASKMFFMDNPMRRTSVFVGDQSTTHTPLRRRRLIGLDSLHVKELRRYAPVGQLGLLERWLGVHASYDSYQRVCAVPAGLTIPSP